MFRAATGDTPHRYLLHLRVKKAQAMMKNKKTHLIDIALAVQTLVELLAVAVVR
jgi:transcriptional regulator GlxA family with amidase domain